MKIAIDASKLTIEKKTGTEIYSYELITRLLLKFPKSDEIILYSQKELEKEIIQLHPNIKNKVIPSRFMWTIFALSLALIKDKPDIFYTPSSIIPLVHPKKSFVVIHGLEYEYFPQSYSLFRFWHLAIFTKLSAIWAYKIITPSLSTKNDLVNEYFIDSKKIKVIKSGLPNVTINDSTKSEHKFEYIISNDYIFWIGRKEQRKNLDLLINIFDIIKVDFPNLKLILAGGKGHGYKEIKTLINSSVFVEDIIELEFITEQEKQILYKNAKIFIFPSWYEGFGFPVIEAMSYGLPVICSNSSSLVEFKKDSIMLADPEDINQWILPIKDILSKDNTHLSQKLKDESQKYNFEITTENTYKLFTQ